MATRSRPARGNRAPLKLWRRTLQAASPGEDEATQKRNSFDPSAGEWHAWLNFYGDLTVDGDRATITLKNVPPEAAVPPRP